MNFRPATQADATAIAHLHATSWQQNYRGVYSDEYLDKEVVIERVAFWQDRLKTSNDNQHVLIAKEGEQLLGFVCVFKNYDTKWGAYLDNIHVAKVAQGKGVGKVLMKKAAEWLQAQNADTQFYLWVFEANVAAQNFYSKIGGQPVGIEPFDLEKHGGGQANAVRYLWNDLSKL